MFEPKRDPSMGIQSYGIVYKGGLGERTQPQVCDIGPRLRWWQWIGIKFRAFKAYVKKLLT